MDKTIFIVIAVAVLLIGANAIVPDCEGPGDRFCKAEEGR